MMMMMATEAILSSPVHSAPAAAAAAGSGCSGSVIPAAGGLNPAVPIRSIRTKFAVLAGLIRAGEVSDRDIAETVLNLVSGLVLVF